MKPTPVTQLPARIVENPYSGWTVYDFPTPEAAAEFFVARRNCEMPCWRRMDVINGALMLVR